MVFLWCSMARLNNCSTPWSMKTATSSLFLLTMFLMAAMAWLCTLLMLGYLDMTRVKMLAPSQSFTTVTLFSD